MTDLDFDGTDELIVGNLFGEVRYFDRQGMDWTEISGRLDGVAADQNAAPAFADLDYDGDADLILGNYAGTFHYFENKTPVSAGKPDTGIPPAKFRLTGVRPNPFNSVTNLEVSLPESGDLQFAWFDLLGRKLQHRLLPDRKSGIIRLKISMDSRYAGGVYLFKIQFSNGSVQQQITGKLVYLK